LATRFYFGHERSISGSNTDLPRTYCQVCRMHRKSRKSPHWSVIQRALISSRAAWRARAHRDRACLCRWCIATNYQRPSWQVVRRAACRPHEVQSVAARATEILKSAEICPILPHPSRDPRRADRLIIEYRELLFDSRGHRPEISSTHTPLASKTNLGVRSSNLFGRAKSSTKIETSSYYRNPPCRMGRSAWHLHGKERGLLVSTRAPKRGTCGKELLMLVSSRLLQGNCLQGRRWHPTSALACCRVCKPRIDGP
jgi:hypothetical protein